MNKQIPVLVWILAGATFASTLLICWRVIGLIPHIPDELCYLYQGRILASGRLYVQEPPVPEAFTTKWDHILRTAGKWRAIYTPGWPLLLALGWLLHAPWLVNPLLTALSVPGLFLLAKELFDEQTALFSCVIFAVSPFVLMTGAGFMAHPAALFFAIWCLFFLVRSHPHDFMKASAAATMVFMIRPYTAVALLAPAFIWSLWNSKERWKALKEIAIGALPGLVFFGAYNQLLFGNFNRTGYSYDPDARFRGSLLSNWLRHIPWYFDALNKSLWRFPWPDLLIFLPLLKPHTDWKKDALLFVCFISLLFGYSIFYYSDIVYSGPRYVYEAVGFLSILAARAVNLLGDLLKPFLKRKLAPILLLLFLYPLSVMPEVLDYYGVAYHGQSQELLKAVEKKGIGDNALILIAGDPFVLRTFFLQNSLNIPEGQRVFAHDIETLRSEMMRRYPRKETWRMVIELEPLTGMNIYNDRFAIKSIQWERLR